jgi:hypothetical protein
MQCRCRMGTQDSWEWDDQEGGSEREERRESQPERNNNTKQG